MPLLASRRLTFRLAANAALTSAALALVAAPAFAADPAADLVASTMAQGFEIMKSPNSPARQAAIKQVLDSKFDLPFMAQTALGTHWSKATPDQQARFIKATELSESKAYNERFGQYNGLQFKILKTTERPGGVQVVDTTISQASGQPLKLAWEVRQGAQGLRITDVRVEGVSMVMTRRSDFNSYIQNHGGQVDPLITELENRGR